MFDFRGIYTPLLTPFDESGAVNFSALERHIYTLVDQGIHGIFALGSTSESMFMDLGLKKKLLKEIIFMMENMHALERGVGLIAQTGCNVVNETLELSDYAVEMGVRAISIITPFYYSLDTEALVSYLIGIAKRYAQVPLVVYNFPARTSNDVKPHMLRKIWMEAPNVVGVKETTDSLERFREQVEVNGHHVSVLAGTNTHILPALELGCRGAVATLANVVPKLVADIFNLYGEGLIGKAQAHQQLLNSLRHQLKSLGPDLAVYKHSTSILGGYEFGGMYAPNRNLSKHEQREVTRVLACIRDEIEEAMTE
jgi:dihydrodipicolinate synthase/N-acetylneuraminate lyase